MKTVEKKSGFFLRTTGERIHWLPDSYLPEELFGKEKWLLSANIKVKNTLMAGRKSCAKRKSGFFLQISGERIHWLPDSYLPEELFGKEKWLLSANIRGKNTLAIRQLPTNYQPVTCQVEQSLN